MMAAEVATRERALTDGRAVGGRGVSEYHRPLGRLPLDDRTPGFATLRPNEIPLTDGAIEQTNQKMARTMRINCNVSNALSCKVTSSPFRTA